MAGKRNYDPQFNGLVGAAEGPARFVQKAAERMDKELRKSGYRKR